MKVRLVAFLLPFFVFLPVFPGGAVTVTPAYDPEERNRPTGFWDERSLTQEQKNEIGPSGNDAETLGEARRNALEHAFGLIEAKLGGNIDITVDVKFTDELDSTPPDITLASARPCLFQSSLLPREQTLYPSALAKAIRPNDERLRGSGGPCRGRDIAIQFNNDSDNVPFYYGFDEIPADARRFEFVSVVLHEIFHGLGFFELVQEDGSWSTIPGTDRSGRPVEVTLPSIYDEQLYSEADQDFIHNLRQSRRAAAIVSEDGLSWYGRTSAGCSYGRLVGERDKSDDGLAPDGKPLLHAPGPLSPSGGYQDGTSVSHLHVLVNPDDILEPRFPVATRDMTLALALLKDMGWQINDPNIPASCISGPPDSNPGPVPPPDPDPVQPVSPSSAGGSGGCALASDGDFRSEKIFTHLLLMLSVLTSGVFGGRRREKRRA